MSDRLEPAPAVTCQIGHDTTVTTRYRRVVVIGGSVGPPVSARAPRRQGATLSRRPASSGLTPLTAPAILGLLINRVFFP